VIRRARVEDAAAIAALSGELGYPAAAEQMAARLCDVIGREDLAVFVAEEHGTVSGWIHMIECRRLEEDRFAEIGGLVVSETQRGSGIGARLIAAAEQWARERGCGKVFVRSNVIRERAHKFYEREGYVCFKKQAVFSKRLDVDGEQA